MVTDNIYKYIEHGSKDRHWYKGTEELFVNLYGRERLPLVTSLFAATSINSSLKSNIRLFRRALHEIENNLPLGNYLPVMRMQIERIRNGEKIQGRKISAFAAAMSGDRNAVVVDIWLLRAFEMDNRYFRSNDGRERSGGATDKQFTMIEDYVRNLSITDEPRELSAMIWSGVRSMKSKDKETRYHEILKHQLFNMYDKV